VTIVAIADVFDALVSERPYKQPWSFETALAYLQNERGEHFDPTLIDIFVENIETIRAIYQELKD
jgi:response regulator RpfG family c-di-GMP phosphodiesterase